MTNTVRITLGGISQDEQDIFVARLADIGYDGFEQNDSNLMAYIPEADFDAELLTDVTGSIAWHKEVVVPQNWNALWESNFEPVVVDGFCVIRADFHQIEVTTPYEIVITPKMSFGTGHHATTQLMMTLMRDMSLKDATVFDFGTGTGVLAILAEMLGASKVEAVDNDEWSVTNTEENIVRNSCSRINVRLVGDRPLAGVQAQVVLANINRHVLLQYMDDMFSVIASGGMLLLSGILQEDKDIVVGAATTSGFSYLSDKHLNNWLAILLFRP